MSNSISLDHHADFAGWKQPPEDADLGSQWSHRKSVGYLVACALLSWLLFLAPLLLIT